MPSSKKRLDGFLAMAVGLTARYSAYAPPIPLAPNTASREGDGNHDQVSTAGRLGVSVLPFRKPLRDPDDTAVLLIFTRISSRAMVGAGTSLNTNCPPYSNNLTAFMRTVRAQSAAPFGVPSRGAS